MTTNPSIETPEEVVTNEDEITEKRTWRKFGLSDEEKKEYKKTWANIKLKPAPPDLTIPDIMVAPAPRCYKCGERMILMRLFRNEVHLREYWKCYTKGCKHKLQIGDDGNPIYSDIQKKSEPKQERLL